MEFGLRDWARREPERIAVTIAGETTSFGALEAVANRTAHLFRACGLRPGDHVAAVILNDPMIFAIAWAAYRAGLYMTPIASNSSLPDIARIVVNSTAKLVLADARLTALAGLPGITGSEPRWFANGGALAGFESFDAAIASQPASPLPDETAGSLMMYTSGTTGAPRGVWRPLPAPVAGPPPFARDLLTLFDIGADCRYLSTQPLYHAAALRFGLAFMAAGASVVVMPKFDAATALDLIETQHVTHSQWVPTMFQRMLALPAERLARHHCPWHRVALHSAAPCPPPVKRAMIDWWGPILQEYYSGSEGVGLTRLNSEEWLSRPGSVGRCVKGTLHILGDDDVELGPGERGRIYFSGIPPFQYFNDPGKTAGRTSRQGYQTFGDIGHRDAEGYLFLTDRQDDMIISGGVNIYPQELEGALMECPKIQECAVVGLPDADFGERAVAFVVPRDPPFDTVAFTAEIDAFCRERLGRVKRPREIRLIDALPRSETGKLLRRKLKTEPAPAGALG
jgi:acyl-CoA synthetase (AMP-forming)/AMP-acid ligase II